MFTKIITLVSLIIFSHTFVLAASNVPSIRVKVGYMLTTFSAGDIYTDENLGSLLTIQPTINWSFPNFRSRLGIHLSLDVMSEFGLTPLSGIGINGYIYPWGISTSHEKMEDGTIIQKSKSGLFIFIALTPVNFNINSKDEFKVNETFSSVIYDATLGLGYDYALKRNIIVSAEVDYRFGNAANDSQGLNGINYSGFGIMLSFLTSYY